MAASQDNEKGLGRKDSFNIVYALAKGHSTCFLVFMRTNFGTEALGWPGLMAFIIMLAVGGFGRMPAEMWPFLGIWFVVLACQRASTMLAVWRGVVRHSRYDGDVDNNLAKLFGSRAAVKMFVEPLVCIACGVLLEQYLGASHKFAMFVGLGGLSMAFVALIDRQVVNKRVQAMHDAAIEQSYLAAKYRGEIDD